MVTLVGRDAAPSKAFGRVAEELEKRGVKCAAFLGGGKPIIASTEQIAANIKISNFVMIGMSSSSELAKEELFAARVVVEAGVPFGFYSDTFGSYQRPWFETFRYKASLLLVLNEQEKAAAQKLYPNAEIVVAGNHEWEDAAFPKYSREEMRSKLGVAENETLVFLPGHKSVPITSYLLMSAVHAMNQVAAEMGNRGWKVILAPHPGDGVSPKAYAEPVLFTKVPVAIVTKEKTYVRKENSAGSEPELEEREGGFPSSDILPAADLLVESASTFCQAAAIRRIPVISVLSEVSKQRNVVVFGKRDWEPVLQAVALEVYGNANGLACQIKELYSSSDSWLLNNLRRRQEELYPGFKSKGEFARVIVDHLVKFIQ